MLLDPETTIDFGCDNVARGDLDFFVVRDIEGIERIRPVWEQMQNGERFQVPHADIDRYLACVKSSGDEVQPYIVLVKRDGHLEAMIIGRIEWRTLRIRLGYKTLFSPKVRCLSIVYGGIVGQPSDECCGKMIDELVNVLCRKEADVAFLNHLRTDSAMHRLCTAQTGFWSRYHCALADPHWRTSVPESMEEFYRRVPGSRKRRWNRNVRQLERMNSSKVRIACYRRLSDIDQLIKMACLIEESTYKKGLAAAFTDSALNRALLEQAARDGWLKAYVLYVGDEPCAFQFDTRYRGTQFTEYGSFDPRWSRGSPGIVLLTKVLEQLCEESDVQAVDYGFGHADYKEKFGTDCWSEGSVYIYAPRFRPMLIKMAMYVNQAFSVALGRATACLKLDSWVKRNWRRMLRAKGN